MYRNTIKATSALTLIKCNNLNMKERKKILVNFFMSLLQSAEQPVENDVNLREILTCARCKIEISNFANCLVQISYIVACQRQRCDKT